MREPGTNAIDCAEIIAVCAKHARAAVIDEINEIVRGQAKIQWHQHRAQLRHGVERLQLRMSIGREIGNAIARANAEPLQNRRPPIAPIEELGVAPARLTIDDGDAFGIKFARPAGEFEWRERRFHWSRSDSGYHEIEPPATKHR